VLATATLALFTSHAEQFRYDAPHNGYVFAFVGILGAIIQGGLLGRLVKKFGEASLVIVGLVSLAAGLLFLPFTTGLYGLLVALALIANGNSLAGPNLTALASRRTSKEKQGEILGVTQSLNSLARIIAPVTGNLLLGVGLSRAAATFADKSVAPASAMASPFIVSSAVTAIALAFSTYYKVKWGNSENLAANASSPKAKQDTYFEFIICFHPFEIRLL